MVDVKIKGPGGESSTWEAPAEEPVEEKWPVVEAPRPEVDTTPLFDLKSRRAQIAQDQFKAFQVPRWEDPELWIEVGIVEPTALQKALANREKKKKTQEDWVAWAYCDVLVKVTRAVYATMEEKTPGAKYSLRPGDPTGEPTKIDFDLARALGLDPNDGSAAETFRRLFFAEGDLIDFANKVFRWSAVVTEDTDEDF